MTVRLNAGDSVSLTTGRVTRSTTHADFHRARLAENQLPALAWFLRRDNTPEGKR